jgi:Transposase, Mutator family
VLGLAIGTSEAETPELVEGLDRLASRKLARRGLRGVKLVISDAHEGLKAAIARVLNSSWQRCRVHFMRNALAHAGKQARRVVSAFIATAFAQDDAKAARAQWRQVADQLRPRVKKLAELMDEAESDVLAYMSFPPVHRPKLHSTNPIERLNGEIKRRTEVVGIFPNDEAVIRLVGAILLEQHDEWAVQRARYMTLETMAPSTLKSSPPSTPQTRASVSSPRLTVHSRLISAIEIDIGKLTRSPERSDCSGWIQSSVRGLAPDTSITNDDAGMPQKQRLGLVCADRKDPNLGPTNRRRRDVQFPAARGAG